MAEFVLKYQRQVYVDKYNAVNGILGRLETNLGELEQLKTDMFNFWNDEAARQAGSLLQDQIQLVKNQINLTKSWLKTYEKVTDELDRGSTLINDIADEAKNALEAVGSLSSL